MSELEEVLKGERQWSVALGDCIELLKTLPDNSADSVVTDPPYDLAFMNKKWDTTGIAFKPETWKEVLRVLKPGGHLAAFGGTRTFHRMACAIEDAGFEIRDCIVWCYAQGFPKSLDIGKAIDKSKGAERKVVRKYKRGMAMHPGNEGVDNWRENYAGEVEVTVPSTDQAKKWQGWGTALKPAQEPIVVARKPLSESSITANVLKHGTGGLNIDGCRIAGSVPQTIQGKPGMSFNDDAYEWTKQPSNPNPSGRWPANLVFTHLETCVKVGTKKISSDAHYTNKREVGKHGIYGKFKAIDRDRGNPLAQKGMETIGNWKCAPGCPVAELDRQSGTRQSGMMVAGQQRQDSKGGGGYHGDFPDTATAHDTYGDSGGASRFYFTAKASPGERWFYCLSCNVVDRVTDQVVNPDCPKHGNRGERDFGPLFGGSQEPKCACPKRARDAHEDHKIVQHPTQKPEDLMKWLVRLITPPGGVCLDPFTGSGTTGVACLREKFRFVGMEIGTDYHSIACSRIRKTETLLRPRKP